MSNLRLLSEHSATGVNNVSVNTIFTDDYSIYNINSNKGITADIMYKNDNINIQS